LSEFQGVRVGSASTVAPAAASARVVVALSSTSNAIRTCPATRRPTSASSTKAACVRSNSSSVARPASRMVTRPSSGGECLALAQSEDVAVEEQRLVVN
jgi:hypothetical protein